jgi:hypothetical protein
MPRYGALCPPFARELRPRTTMIPCWLKCPRDFLPSRGGLDFPRLLVSGVLEMSQIRSN